MTRLPLSTRLFSPTLPSASLIENASFTGRIRRLGGILPLSHEHLCCDPDDDRTGAEPGIKRSPVGATLRYRRITRPAALSAYAGGKSLTSTCYRRSSNNTKETV